jgi:hypothetical protein
LPLGQLDSEAVVSQHGVARVAVRLGRHEVHRGRADEARDEHVARARVQVLRRADLLQYAQLHDRDAVAHRHRLDLVVGDVDRRRAEPLLELEDLRACGHA